MRKILLGSLAATLVLLAAAPAFAQHHRRDHGYRQPHARQYYAPPRQHYHPPRQRNNWVPYALGGLALGALGAGSYYYYNNRQCWDEMIGYDRYGREVFERYCR